MIFEWSYPKIDDDWANCTAQWREIPPLTYRVLKDATPSLHQTTAAFMQAEPVDILADGEGLFVCCKQENGFYFARLLPSCDWWKRDYLPLPDINSDIEALFSP